MTVMIRAANRAMRQLTATVPAMRRRQDREHTARLQRHEPHLPHLSPDHARVVDALREQGVLVAPLDSLALPGVDQLRTGAARLVEGLRHATAEGPSTVRPARSLLLAEGGLWGWGLQERLLDVAENYLGLPARYYGADLRCERADGHRVDVRQWHRDVEDHRIFKILVWLDDVDLQGGPTEYVERSWTASATSSLRYVSGFVSDEAFARAVPREHWKRAAGAAMTAVVVDTRNVFHRAMPPVSRDRYSVTFTWTSRHPVKTYPVPRFSRDEAAEVVRHLTPRQVACLPQHVTAGL